MPVSQPRRKPLEPWQRDDAARLKKLWDAGNPGSQDAFGAEFKIGGQAAVWQYLSGRIPLNLLVAAKFAKGLGCALEDISPKLAEEAKQLIVPRLGEPAAPHYQDALVSKYRAADAATRELVDLILENFQSRQLGKTRTSPVREIPTRKKSR